LTKIQNIVDENHSHFGGLWDAHPGHHYAAYTGSTFPTTKQLGFVHQGVVVMFLKTKTYCKFLHCGSWLGHFSRFSISTNNET
jgi:hypothetical protein